MPRRPERVQLRRTRGWRKPDGVIVVARPSRWGNPHRIEELGRAEAKARYEADLLAGRLRFTLEEARAELAGHDLACWCAPDEECHADVLLRHVNR